MSIKVLVVDDSALMRKLMRGIFDEAGGFEVRIARDGQDALDKIAEDKPDVVTLDINMPRMDGITALSHIMSTDPVPVLMVSSLTEEGARVTFEALELGAFDYVPKPSGTISLSIEEIAQEVLKKTKQAARSRVKRARNLRQRIKQSKPRSTGSKALDGSISPPVSVATEPLKEVDGLLLVGSSTGGPRSLDLLIPQLPATYDRPVVIVQHMPATFTAVMSERLNNLSPLNVIEVSKLTLIERGKVYVAQGDRDIEVVKRPNGVFLQPVPSSSDYIWHPSVDRLVWSALEVFTPQQLNCVLLTGMGDDGAKSMAFIADKGGKVIAESEETCAVYGMPRALAERSPRVSSLPADRVASKVRLWR